MYRTTPLILGVLLLAQIAHAQLYDLFEPKVYQSGKQRLNYRLLKPASLEKEVKYPLIIFLHGAGERGDNNRAQLVHVLDNFVVSKNRQEYPCYILAPQCPRNGRWTDSDFRDQNSGWPTEPSDLETLIMAVTDSLVEFAFVDPDRIYIMGLSMGGIGTWDMLGHYPDRFAAAVPICGVGSLETVERIKNIPIWAFHGRDDGVVPFSGSADIVRAIQQVGGKAILTGFDQVGHNSWDYVFERQPFVYDWLFAQRN